MPQTGLPSSGLFFEASYCLGLCWGLGFRVQGRVSHFLKLARARARTLNDGAGT